VVASVLDYFARRDAEAADGAHRLPPIEPCDLSGARVPTRVLLVDTDAHAVASLKAELRARARDIQ
jgi:hypothetical protein